MAAVVPCDKRVREGVRAALDVYHDMRDKHEAEEARIAKLEKRAAACSINPRAVSSPLRCE